MGSGDLDAGLQRGEGIPLQRLVGVADVFRHEGEEDPALAPIGRAAREEVEELEECGLSSGCDGDVLRTEGPSELTPQKAGQRLQASHIATWRIIDGKGAAQHRRIGDDLLHPLFPDLFHRGYMGGITSSQHERGRIGGCRQGISQIGHQVIDPSSSRQACSKF